jgi:hypothetical protein
MAAKTKTEKPISLAEEAAAVKAEQKRPSKPISVSGLKKVIEVHDIKEQMAPLQARLDQIKADMFQEMDNKGVDVLTRKGVEVVSRDEITQENFDKNALKATFPEIAVQFIVTKIGYRINWKNRFTI